MRTRRLTLSKETLTELRAEELVDVVGAARAITPAVQCARDVTSQVINCNTLLRPCTTR